MTAIAGIFSNQTDANLAATELVHAGFDSYDISFLVSEQSRDLVFNGQTTVKTGAKDAARGGLMGAAAGGVLGALAAGLTAIAFPGGGVLVAGPVAMALAGGGAGAALGTLSGALVEAGFSQDEAGSYADELKNGKAIIVVHPEDERRIAAARGILRMAGAATRAA